MIRELLARYGENSRRDFGYDRRSWVGSSEIGKCLRQVAFGKIEEYEPDPEFVEGWGFQVRGSVIEDFAVKAIRESLPPGAALKYAGKEQETLVDEWLSATTDGVFVGMPRDWLAPTIADTGPGGVVWDCKSLDPRYSSRLPKPEHTAQVQAAMGIIRKSYYPECPDYAVLSYIDASDWSKVQEFVIKFDPARYQDILDRARAIKFCDNPADLPAEEKVYGFGKECRWCPYQRQCGDGQVAALPEDRGIRLPKAEVKQLKILRDSYVELRASIDLSQTTLNIAEEGIKQLLREHGARAHKELDGSWSVQWSTVKGRSSLDTRALEAAGFDLSPYRKEGNPSERLTVK